MSRRIKTFPAILTGVLLGAAISTQTGCKPKQVVASESAPRVSTNTALQAELDRVTDLPIEYDPAKRPLVLSQPAANRRQWALQALREGYQATGKTNALWDPAVERAFEAFADYSRISTSNWPALEKALTAVATSCDDPMIQYMRVRYETKTRPDELAASEFLRAHDSILRSQYHPVFKFYAGVRAAKSARTADKTTKRGNRLSWTTLSLEDIARDTNAPVDEVFAAASLWLDHSNSKDWNAYVTGDLEPILERNWGQSEQWSRFRGQAEVGRAWGERGPGFADTVTIAGWQGFKEHLKLAEDSLMKAWQMNSNSHQTAYLMMRVELGQGRGRSRMELWFNRAMSLDTDFYDAAHLMSFYLQPRWYGSEQAALVFARSCVASDKWGGQVPLVLVKLHHSLAMYNQLSNSPAYWKRPEVWRDVKSSYEKFFKLNPDAAGWRHDYAMDAYNCGEPSVFLEQIKLFAYGTNHTFFGGPEKFQSMLEKATAVVRGSSP